MSKSFHGKSFELGRLMAVVEQADALVTSCGSIMERAGVPDGIHDKWSEANRVLSDLSRSIRVESNKRMDR